VASRRSDIVATPGPLLVTVRRQSADGRNRPWPLRPSYFVTLFGERTRVELRKAVSWITAVIHLVSQQEFGVRDSVSAMRIHDNAVAETMIEQKPLADVAHFSLSCARPLRKSTMLNMRRMAASIGVEVSREIL
jgi:hypothetical protein